MASSASHSEVPPVPAPSNPVLLKTQAHWYFTDDELTRTPSQLDGMAMEAEHMSRSKGVNFISQVGIMLKLPQLTLATAAVYFHRFYMRHSMVDLPQRPGIHPYTTAAAALFLATKVEENVRRMKELVVACCRVGQKQPNMVVDEQSKEFWRWRDTILVHEDIVLEALCFDLQLEQPYRILYDFICFLSMQDNKPLRNAAWAFVNDSGYTVLCLQFTARTIAAAALYAAAQHCDVGFEDDVLGRPWWEQLDVELPQVRRACMRMAKLYENNAANRHTLYYLTNPISTDEGTEKTRIPRAGGPTDTTRAADAVRESDAVNGRKRSREPDTAVPLAPTTDSTQPPDPGPTTQNGGRSPKRPRTDSEGTSIGRVPSSRIPKAPVQDRQPANGHGPAAPYSHAYPTSSRPPHPLPPPPRPFARRDSTSSRPGGGNPGVPVDPIQQRIDEIVQQNMPSQSGPGRADRRPQERPRSDWPQEPDPARRRRPSGSTGGRPPPPDEPQPSLSLPSPPPPPPPEEQPEPPQAPEPEDDGGGSEEGEL
ncbi:putative cyclin [Aspergillus ibericus CBS 121593]|uniref:RNA polymerase II holoenzyme cyclin-like subunit n=1 Tax=Aspergillus ibericus CBS 121593 TaxID=1448316 RepID=A0A395GW68_9EURO|nr:cyclin-like protein [Aspergillus ibericus CBS 121593]RAK99821.1 cyclin-like protein [Aspergillus ibericus CBS 121593]